MRLEQTSLYTSQNIGIGAKQTNISKKANLQSSSNAATPKATLSAGTSPFLQFGKELSSLSKRITRQSEVMFEKSQEMIKNGAVPEDGNEWTDEHDKLFALENEKKQLIQAFLESKGIKGELTVQSGQSAPDFYSTYLFKTEDSKSLFILELEDGQLLFGEPARDLSTRESGIDFAILRRDLFGFTDGINDKLSTDQLKQLFAKFIGVEELKDFNSYELEKMFPQSFSESFEAEVGEDF